MSDNTKSTSYWEPIRTISLVAIIVLSVPIAFMGAAFVEDPSAGIASAATDNTSYYDDFEDGDANGWDIGSGQVVQDGFTGSNSLELVDGGGAGSGTYWTGGPTIDMSENFELVGTYNASGTSGRTVFGVADPDSSNSVQIINSFEDNTTALGTNYDATADSVAGARANQWNQFRMQIQSGTVRVKVWAAGTQEPDNWMLEADFESFEGQFWATAGESDYDRTLKFDHVDAGGHSISGQVLDQEGNPVSNATVETYAVDYDALNETTNDLNQSAQDLLEEAAGVDLSLEDVGFDENFDWDSMTERNADYVLAHKPEDFGTVDGPLDYAGESVTGGGAIEEPTVVFGPDDTQIFSVWAGANSGADNFLDNSYPGGIRSAGEVQIEQLSPTGEVTDSWTKEASATYTVERSYPFDDSTRDVVQTSLPAGNFYRVYPTTNEAASIVIFVGDDPKELIEKAANQIQGQLETEAGQLTSQAQNIQQNIETGPFKRVTTTTDENGYYELRVPTGVQRAAVQAYRANGEYLSTITGPSLQDLRSASKAGYNGTYFLAAPEFTDVPQSNVTIRGYETQSLPWQDMKSFSGIQDWLEEEYESWLAKAETDTPWVVNPNATSTEEFRNRLEDLNDVIGASDTLKEAYLNLSDRDSLPNAADLSREELKTEIQNLESALSVVESGMIGGTGDGPVFGDDGLLSAEFPYPDDLNESATSVMIRWTDGEMTPISEEYVSVEDGGFFGGDTVVVEDLPIEDLANGRTFGQIQVNAVSESGEHGTVETGIQLPGFEGIAEPPEAIRFSDIRPDGDEHVTAKLIAGESSSIDSITDVLVRGPQGQELNATILDDNRVRFKTSGVGTHMIRFVYQNGQGSKLASVTSLEASSESFSAPPTVRVEKPTFGDGRVAVIGGGLQSASAEYEGDSDEGSLSVTAVQNDDGDTISELNIRALEETSNDLSTLDVQVLDADETTIDSHVIVNVHTSMSGEALLRHAAGPITHDGSTNYGSVETRELSNGQTVRIIQTRTDANGAIDGLEINNNPGYLDRLMHYLSVQTGFSIENPIDMIPIPMNSDTAFWGLFGFAAATRGKRRLAA